MACCCKSQGTCGSVLKQIVVLAMLSFILGGITWAVHPHVPSYQDGRLEAGEILLASVPPGTLWVDARSQAEYEAEHVPGAILLNEDDWDLLLAEFINHWQQDQPVVVYCGGGECHASKTVVARLKEYFPDMEVYHLKDGWSAWKESHP